MTTSPLHARDLAMAHQLVHTYLVTLAAILVLLVVIEAIRRLTPWFWLRYSAMNVLLLTAGVTSGVVGLLTIRTPGYWVAGPAWILAAIATLQWVSQFNRNGAEHDRRMHARRQPEPGTYYVNTWHYIWLVLLASNGDPRARAILNPNRL